MNGKRKHKIVLFMKDAARVIVTDDPRPYLGVPNVAIDPDLKGVAGHPPHYWRLDDEGKIVPITNEEKIRRDQLASGMRFGFDELEEFFKDGKRSLQAYRYRYAGAGALAATFLITVILLALR